MSKQSDDFRAYLGSLFDGSEDSQASQAPKAEPERKPTQSEPEREPEQSTEASPASDKELSTEELFRQGAQAAQEQRRQREIQAHKERAKEAAAWLENSVRDESSDSARGFDFLDEDEEPHVPLPDEWPAFTDIDKDNIITRYGASAAGDEAGAEVSRGDDVIGKASEASTDSSDACSGDSSKGALGRFSRHLVGALAVLALAGGAAYGIVHEHNQNNTVDAPAFQGAPVSAQLACAGTFERTLEVGMNVEDVDERISDSALLLATGSAHIDDKRINAPSLKAQTADASDNSREATALGILSLPQARGIFSADEATASLAGLNFHRADAGDMRGLASATCVSGQVDSYLIGSQMSVGTSNDLVLVNLSSAPTTVQLEALGSSGFLEASSVENIVVDARAVKRVSLDGAIDGDERLALHISAPTGAVAAFVQETALDGAKPAGVSWISPAASSKNLVIPAVSIPSDSVDFPRVRIANFEDKPATVSLVLRSHEGENAREELSDIEISAHSVLDIPLDGIDGGVYSVVISSGIPVSAGVELAYRQSEDALREIAWASALTPAYEAMAAIGDVTATLVVTGEENGTASVTFYDKKGARIDTQKVEISGTRSGVVNVPSEAVGVRVSADVPVASAIIGQVSFDKGMGIDWIPLVARADDVSNQRISVW